MASKSSTKCLRALRSSRLSTKPRTSLISIPARSFMTTPHYYVELPEPSAGPATSIPPVTPHRAQGEAQAPLKTPKAPTTATSIAAARSLKKIAGGATETYTAYGVTERYVAMCSGQADYTIAQAQDTEQEMPKTKDGEDLGVGSGWWHTELGLQPTFSTWSQVTMLHMYLFAARFRCYPTEHSQVWQQHLLDHFFYDAENRMTINHNMHARGTRNKYLKDLFIQWRGLLAAYDEGLVKGDAVLAAAVWRNVYKADENVNIAHLATIVSYMRRTLKELDAASDDAVSMGQIEFGKPEQAGELVREKSPLMDLPLQQGKVVNEPVQAKA